MCAGRMLLPDRVSSSHLPDTGAAAADHLALLGEKGVFFKYTEEGIVIRLL